MTLRQLGFLCFACAIVFSFAALTHARELSFDAIAGGDDDGWDINEKLSNISNNPLYKGNSTAGQNPLALRNGGSTGTPNNELYFDVFTGTDDTDRDIDLSLTSTLRLVGGNDAEVSPTSPLATTPTSFQHSVQIRDPSGVLPPVDLLIEATLAPGLQFTPFPNTNFSVVRVVDNGFLSFGAHISVVDDVAFQRNLPLFSTLRFTATSVPEPSACALSAVGVAALWRTLRRLRRPQAAT